MLEIVLKVGGERLWRSENFQSSQNAVQKNGRFWRSRRSSNTVRPVSPRKRCFLDFPLSLELDMGPHTHICDRPLGRYPPVPSSLRIVENLPLEIIWIITSVACGAWSSRCKPFVETEDNEDSNSNFRVG